MKIVSTFLFGICLVLPFYAQTPAIPEAAPPPAAPAEAAAPLPPRSPEVLDKLLGPIALYPDALVALILPAATTPSDVVLAARYVQAGGNSAQAAAQPWDDSVKALVSYPDVLKWMDANLAWTQALGQAFAEQPADVMNTVQHLRTRARASGALVDTPQQRVVVTGEAISIVPAQPEVIYVPVYDPEVVYVSRTVWVNRPIITFSFFYPLQTWFVYDCDWGHRRVWVVSRPVGSPNRPVRWDYDRPVNQPGHAWRPPVYRVHSREPVWTRPTDSRPLRPDDSKPRIMPASPRQQLVTPEDTEPRPKHVSPTRPSRLPVAPPVAAPVLQSPPALQPPPRFERPVPGRGSLTPPPAFQPSAPSAPPTTPDPNAKKDDPFKDSWRRRGGNP
ncbi:MAG: DUF3300 domain-containing protein [Verrucomicrobia bacterium]|nr:DUF3300 domain-containing protein [Verrucomicrobiota bacterium]